MSLPFPKPGGGDELDLLRETVEVQARTIRYLLTNYDALLRKVEREEGAEPAAARHAPPQPPQPQPPQPEGEAPQEG